MRIQTRGNSNVAWLSSGEGVINGTMSLSAPTLERILQAINEKYGTSFEGWAQKPSVYEVGNTVPNWNAYEKIEMPPTIYVKTTPTGSSLWTMGKILGNTFKILCQDNESAWQVTNEGVINGVFGNEQSLIEQIWTPKLQQAGYAISSYEIEIVAYNVGDSIENWNDFTQI